MEKETTGIDDAIQRMQHEAKARGVLRLNEIYGKIFSKDELVVALEHSDLNVERAAVYLQDRLPAAPGPELKTQQTQENFEEIFKKSPDEDRSETNKNPEIKQIPCPNTGKIALEFSLSPQYIDCTIPVVYLSDEILKEIFSFFSPSERGRLGSVCKTFKMIDESAVFLYKRDCLAFWTEIKRPENSVFCYPFDSSEVLWGEKYPEKYVESKDYVRGFKTWRNMWIRRPKIRFQGVYIARVCYFKQGQINMDNLPSFHKVVFYRYLRFYRDFSVCCLNTTKKPREVFRLVDKGYADSRLGEWVRFKNDLRIHLNAKNEVFSYDLDVRSSEPYLFDLLKLEKVQSRSVSEVEYYEMNINNDAWPRYFKYYPL